MIKLLLPLLLVVPAHVDRPPALDWQPCPGDSAVAAQCADLAVPLTATRAITVKLGRLPATGVRKGTVLVNFGGPQGDQIAIMRSRPRIFDRIRESMDVVTWDPRGYPGLSGPVLDCDWRTLRTPRFPADQAGFDRLVAENRARGDRCRDTDPELVDRMDSGSDARDVEAIRVALGEPRVNFIGTSYGGVIAQSYARRFPHRVRTVYVDGTGNHSTRDWDRELDAMARDYEAVVRRFLDWAGPGVEERWQALVAKADAEPVPAPSVGTSYDGTQLQALAFAKLRPGPSRWDEALRAVTAAEAGDASGFAPPGRDPEPGLPGGGVKECLDFPRSDFRQVERTVERLRRIAPNIGAAFPMAWHLPLTCAGWPTPTTNPPAPLPSTLPPFLGAGTWQDYGLTTRVTDQVRGSRAIYHDGPGHNLFAGMANPCVIEHVSAYVTDRRLPPAGATCP
ncbi:alpha/beta fold hydrolase [Saccharothrix texasensis]|uniref:alpha/beta fold hydrolase n=1 Tax=Saccharothrix texasensis TaxID=103734 RepID=UPI0011CE755E|nr:alpha/beta fold hydrolase [Saccharothrix texasensis]